MRLFVAVGPSGEIRQHLEALPRPDVAGLRWTTPDQWHVTLSFLGEVAEERLGQVVEAAGAAAGASRSQDGPVMAHLGPCTMILGRQVLCIPVGGLEELAERTVAELAGRGLLEERRAFRGHLTLARAGRRRRVPRALAGAPLAASWAVDDLAVVHSSPAAGTHRYRTVERCPLA